MLEGDFVKARPLLGCVSWYYRKFSCTVKKSMESLTAKRGIVIDSVAAEYESYSSS